jgi:exosortase
MKYYDEQAINRLSFIFSVLSFLLYGFIVGCMGNTHAPHLHGHSILSWLVSQWSLTDNWYCWLIPPICGYLVWKRRDKFKRVRKTPGVYAIFLILLCIFLYWAGYIAQQPRLSTVGVIFLLWSMLFFLYGWNFAKVAFFPAVYLLFAIPPGTLSSVTIHLRILVCQVATFLLNGFGIGAIRQGTMIISESGRFVLHVDEPCSGLHSFFALAPLIAAYADTSEKLLWKKWVIFFSTVPVAILANVIRIIVVALAGEWLGSESATNFYHTWSGYIVFIVAVLCVTGLSSVIKRYFPDSEMDKTIVSSQEKNNVFCKPSVRLFQHVILSMLLIGTIAGINLKGEVSVSDKLPIKPDLPDKIGNWNGYKVMWCQNEKCRKQLILEKNEQVDRCPVCGTQIYDMSIAEKKILTSDAILSRKFYSLSKDEPGFMVSAVIAGKDRSSLHPPQWCLPGQGYKIQNEQTVTIKSPDNVLFNVRLLTLQAENEKNQVVLYAYWFAGYKKETSSHIIRLLWTTWNSIIRREIDRWAYISIGYISHDNIATASKNLTDFIGRLHDEIILR